MARQTFKRSGKSKAPPLSRKALVFGVAAILGAGAAVANAAVNMLHARAPDLALAIDGGDPVALIRSAELKRAAGDEAARSSAAVLSAVQRSVDRLPLNGPAFRLYGLSSATNADLGAMRAQMRVSDQMERRDVGTQLWLIENAVEQNDVNRALRHYDTALRIEETSRALLYPVLTGAMDSALIRERFTPYMAANPPWLESFLRFAVSKTGTPVSMAELARFNGGWPEGAAFSSLDTELLARLFSNEDYAAAVDHFRRIDGADQSILTSLQLTNASTNWRLAPIAWQPFQINGIETYILASPEGSGAMEIEAEVEAGYKGPVARKFLALEPGRYSLSAAMRAEDFSRQDLAGWALSCAGGNGGAALLSEETAFDETMALSATFVVPAGCPVQSLMVSAETLVTTRYVKLILASAQLRKLGAAPAAPSVQEPSSGA
ncbi:MAG: hypothetical protein HRT64_00045 [Erythrobacter sp.]|nr:hypothetical protein [Erythrobacter sp.]